MSDGLSKREIMILVNRYIGVDGGYLGDFTYRTHADFYPLYCDLDIDPYQYDGTTRERFIEIISNLSPIDQSKIIRGVLDRFPIDVEYKPETRTQKLFSELLTITSRLDNDSGVSIEELDVSYEVIEQALRDSEILIKQSGASSGIDRIYTALHGYMEFILDRVSISYEKDLSITGLYKIIKNSHPAFLASGHREQDIKKILRTLSSIIDTLQPIRNKASLAHPNDLLEMPEAMLVINSTRTIINYLENKINIHKRDELQEDEIPF